MKNYIAFIITHGDLAFHLNEVSQKLIPSEIPLYCFSNSKDSIENIIDLVLKVIENDKPEKVIVFVDLLGGSCWHAAMSVKKQNSNVAILTGINIPALVSFMVNYSKLEWPELLDKITQDAQKAIKLLK